MDRKKGEGLMATCVVSHLAGGSLLWVIVFDNHQPLALQVLVLGRLGELPEEEISQRWAQGYIITSIAGAHPT